MILGLAVIIIIIVVYASSTEQYIHQGEFYINLPDTSVHNSNETAKDVTQQTVINNMSKWQPVGSHNIGVTVFSGDNKTAVPSQKNIEIKLKLTSHSVNALPTTRPTTNGGGKKKIIVLTTMRSGSSFIGRILHEHPDICYLFEPLQIVNNKATINSNILDTNDKLNSFFQNLFSCAFTDALRDAKALPAHDRNLTYRPCTTFLRYSDKRHNSRCRLTDIERTEVMCRRARYVAMKVIRVFPSQLALITKYLKEEVQIIHLNRDPRGVISSRLVASRKKQNINAYIIKNYHTLIEKASSHCKRIRDTIIRLALWTAIEPSSSKFYHLIRYEDFAYHPEANTKSLYSSLGLKLHSNVLTWLRKATTFSKPVGGLYSTKRNSTATAEAWRNKLPFHFVRAMQELPDCQFIMRRLGYEFAQSESMLHDRSVSLVLKSGITK